MSASGGNWCRVVMMVPGEGFPIILFTRAISLSFKLRARSSGGFDMIFLFMS